MKSNRKIKRGEIYYADLDPVIGSEQGGVRPVLIIQNDVGNEYSPTVIVAMITSKSKKENMPTHVKLNLDIANGLKYNSVVLCEQLRTIDKSRLKSMIGKVENENMRMIADAMKISLTI